MPKKRREIELLEMALPVVGARGAWQKIEGAPTVLDFRTASLVIAYRSPFQKPPPPSAELIRKHVDFGELRGKSKSLPYGLDIWTPAPRKLVLNIEWSDDGDMLIVGYGAGPWEQELEQLAAEIAK
jgi:hypothetical protein